MSPQRSVHRHTTLRVLSVLVALAATFAFAGSASTVVGTHLIFTQQPSSSLAGQPIAPPVVVTVVDGNGEVLTSVSGPVTIALQGEGTLYGTTTVNAVDGVATFSDLIVNPAGTYTLLATAADKPSAVSDPFTVRGFGVNCLRSPCEASTGDIKDTTPGDPTAGSVLVNVGPCGGPTCFLTVDEDTSCPPSVTCRGNAFLFIPPINATGIIVARITCDLTICPKNVVVPTHKQRANGTWVQLANCPSRNPTLEQIGPDGCIQRQVRTPTNDLNTTVWIPASGDPRIVN